MSSRILFVDGQELVRSFVEDALADYELVTASDVSEATCHLEKTPFDLLILEMCLPNRSDGVRLIEETRRRWPQIKIIALTAYPTSGDTASPTGPEVFDYVNKPFTRDRIRFVAAKGLEHRDLERRITSLSARLDALGTSDRWLGSSPAMEAVKGRLSLAIATETPVLITGESGVGKSTLARLIHEQGPRRTGPFLSVECGGPVAELFGTAHPGGETVGNAGDEPGLPSLLRQAEGGTVVLEDVDHLSPRLQTALLGILRAVPMAGGDGQGEEGASVRFVATARGDLAGKASRGEYRHDLWKLLGRMVLVLPALCERREDIDLLASHFAGTLGAKHGKAEMKVSEEAIRFLGRRAWPGNVRELQNVIEHGVIMCQTDLLTVRDLDSRVIADEQEQVRDKVFREGTIREMEKLMIEERLRRIATRNKAADTLGISVRTLRNKLHLYRRQEAVAASTNT